MLAKIKKMFFKEHKEEQPLHTHTNQKEQLRCNSKELPSLLIIKKTKNY